MNGCIQAREALAIFLSFLALLAIAGAQQESLSFEKKCFWKQQRLKWWAATTLKLAWTQLQEGRDFRFYKTQRLARSIKLPCSNLCPWTISGNSLVSCNRHMQILWMILWSSSLFWFQQFPTAKCHLFNRKNSSGTRFFLKFESTSPSSWSWLHTCVVVPVAKQIWESAKHLVAASSIVQNCVRKVASKYAHQNGDPW